MIAFPSKPKKSQRVNEPEEETPSQTLSRLIGELLECEKSDPHRAAGIRRRIDALADEIEIYADLAALAGQARGTAHPA